MDAINKLYLKKPKQIKINNKCLFIVDNFILKRDIINYIQKNNVFKINHICSKHELDYIKDNKFKCLPNIGGEFYYYVIYKAQHIYHTCLIRYNDLYTNNYNNIKVYSIKNRVSEELYKGTIFLGKLVITEDSTFFYIIDSSVIMGNNLKHTTKKISNRNKLISSIIKNNFKFDDMSLMKLKTPTYYEQDKLPKLYKKIQKSDIDVNGIMFVSEEVGTIYYFKTEIDTKYSALLGIKKTAITDVYDIYARVYSKHKDEESYKRIGIAGIPNSKVSLYCQQIVTDANKIYPFICWHSDKFNKWVPFEYIPNKNKLTNIKDVDKIINKKNFSAH